MAWEKDGIALAYEDTSSGFRCSSCMDLALIQKGPGLGEARWIELKLVAKVTFIRWTPDGSMRHRIFQDLRDDRKSRMRFGASPTNQSERGPMPTFK